ncbi:MAG: T9SS type A sorting domain-containing protein, partial [Alphaproteobacteria bacterium]|nr:T9SS type A sorting domain-containing protein [Alphaproteobacteria bacterium]
RPFTYDSLCPHPIVSDTVPLDDCEVVIVGLDDAEQHPEKTKLQIYPNPTGGQVNIVMPQYLVRQNPGSILSSTTTWFQWDQTRLDILSITGKLMFTMEIPKQQTTVHINTSAWPAGMYFARVVFMNESVVEGKLVVE